jgi:glycosyltransferase involved in cell wall biosynthesis
MPTVEGPSTARLGVTVAICTYNGAARLPATLEHLRAQSVPAEISWEVLLIDNASTDNSSEVARAHWPSETPAPLRVVREERLGLSYARERAFAEAAYPIVLFVDDDNWLSTIWVKTVSEVMTTRPEVGACAGIVEPAFERPPPPWGSQFTKWPSDNDRRRVVQGDVTDTIGWLMGAGLSVRTRAYRQLCDAGFRHLAVDRQGKELTSGGDIELCYALRIAGWRLWLERSLMMEHFMPARRMTWRYICASMYGVGFSLVALDAYTPLLKDSGKRPPMEVRTWLKPLMGVLRCIAQNLVLRPSKVIGRSSPRYEGDLEVFRIFAYLGRLNGLLNYRREYSANYQVVSRFAERLSDRAGDSVLPSGCISSASGSHLSTAGPR